jgi:hypothetical protein
MRLLTSDIPPLKTGLDSYSQGFLEAFFNAARVDMVVGYVAEDALVELQKLIENHASIEGFRLLVGMARFDGLFQSQFDALKALDDYLIELQLGQVYIGVALPIHAKACVFIDEQKLTQVAIVGSSNLSGLVESFRQFEMDIFLDEGDLPREVASVVNQSFSRASRPLSEVIGDLKIHENPNLVLDGVPNVTRVSTATITSKMTATSFDLLIKPEEKSHLNTFFGKGRMQKGHEIPRPWYEVELIIGVETTRLPGYPKAGSPNAEFDVITDDGWRFACQVQGGNSKNFRSKDDLKTLGKWIKERLQNAGALVVGAPVTAETFRLYGRDTVTFTKLNEPNLWHLDFGRPNVQHAP